MFKNMYVDVLKYVCLGIGDWGLGIGPNPQSPIPNPHNYLITTTKNITHLDIFIILI